MRDQSRPWAGGGPAGFARVAVGTVLLATLLAALLAGCASGLSNVTVSLPSYAASRGADAGAGAAAPAPRAGLNLEPLRDARRDLVGSLIGERTTIGSISMGMIETNPPPVTVVTSLLQAELKGLGFDIGQPNASLRATPRLTRFEVRTPATALYWDIEGTVALELALSQAGAFAHAATYEARCTGRTYVWPGEELIAEVLGGCLKDLGAKLHADGELARMAAGRP